MSIGPFYRHIAYLINNMQLACSLIFYLALAALIISLVNLLDGHGRASVVHASALPYTLAHPYDAKQAAAAMRQSLAAAEAAAPVWPLHGRVTTEFGASDYPFQSSHTGIDISDGRRSGASNVVAFKGGVVVSVIHSSTSYGNHVIIDHGGGLTSLYGHLYSISVSNGQQVHSGDVIGTEGSTGASTGTHVHFEIRQNNIPQNPRRYVPGSP